MSGFKTHKKYGLYVSFFSALAAFLILASPEKYFSIEFSPDAAVIGSVTLFISAFIGSIVPDIDAEKSKPRQYLRKLFLLFSLVASGFIYLKNPFSIREMIYSVISSFSSGLPEESVFIVILTVMILLSILILSFFDKKTKHRGLLHKPYFYFSIGVLLFALGSYIGAETSSGMVLIASSIGIVLGFLAHYSIDVIS